MTHLLIVWFILTTTERLEHPEKSAIVEHNIDQGHLIQFHNSYIRIVREAIEIELNLNNINREGGFCLSKSWKALIGCLKLSGHDPRTLGDEDDILYSHHRENLKSCIFLLFVYHSDFENNNHTSK
jgi:hypothetical protein